MKIQYIENSPVMGVKYDYKKVMKLYKSLGIPPEYDYTNILPLENDAIKWHVLLSERSVGKTTNLLLLGLCMHVLYGTTIQLIRHNAKEQKASYFERLFDTINNYKNGHYIKTLTNGEWDCITYYSRAFYFSRQTEKGKPERKSESFCTALAASDCYSLCSTYEAPRGDWIILDECFNESNTPEEFIHFCHLHKTIVRERMSDKIFILGNNLDINNIWFRQLCIQNEVRKMKRGESKILYTPEQMAIYTAFLENRTPEKRRLFNKSHYGFNNSELNSITGGGEWKIKQYPLACMLKDVTKISRGVYFSYHDDIFMELEMITAASGFYFLIHPANRESAKKGDLLYIMGLPNAENERFFGNDILIQKIVKYRKNNRLVYSDNETGNIFDKFLYETLTI